MRTLVLLRAVRLAIGRVLLWFIIPAKTERLAKMLISADEAKKARRGDVLPGATLRWPDDRPLEAGDYLHHAGNDR